MASAGGGGGPPTHLVATPTCIPEQSQPVDLATSSSKNSQQLRIPTIPTQLRPPSIVPPRMAGRQVNLAVMPGNKVTVLTSATPAKAAPLGASVPKATATTIIRPPTSTFPMTIRTPTSVPTGSGTTSIRLTTTGTAAGSNPSVQFVPVSIAAALRQQGTVASGGLPVSVRPALTGGAVSVRAPGFRANTGNLATTISDAVRVTLVQSPGGSKAQATGQLVQSAGGPKVQNPASLTPAVAAGLYKPVTITSQPQQSKIMATPTGQPVRIGSNPATRMAVMPAAVSLATVPMAHMTKQASSQLQARGLPPGKLISVPSSGSAGSPVIPGASAQGVTIQKTSMPVGQPAGQPGQRTISLPYAAAGQVTAITKPISQAIPVARVCPQPLSSGGGPGASLVTITSAADQQAVQPPGSVYIARPNQGAGPPTQTLQPVAINLTANQAASQSLALAKSRQTLAQADHQLPVAKINLPSQHSRLVVPVANEADKSTNSTRPSILRRREGERDNLGSDTPPPRPDSRNDDAGSSSSGSTTLSATSSPGPTGDRATLSGGEEPAAAAVLQPSPRKKPRKQTLTSTARGGSVQWGENEASPSKVRKVSGQPVANYIRDKPHMSLLNSYRHTWKSRHNHFLRHADVRPREDPRPTVNELANQKHVLQKINGWKIYHLTSQMEDIVDMEAELTSQLSTLQKRLDKSSLSEISRDVAKIQELIKANLQRSKVIQDQIQESKDHALELFEHKSKVTDILNKYISKRQVKKRDIGKF